MAVVVPRQQSLHEVNTAEDWASMAARPEHRVIGRTEIVKFLIDLAHERQLWFTDTDQFPIHYEFARDHLSTEGHPVRGGWQGHQEFNDNEYRRANRRFVMGTIVHYLDADLWTFEMIAGDNLSGERVLRAFRQVQAATFFGSQLRYRPLSPLHERLIRTVQRKLPVVATDEVFGSVRYQPLTEGTAFGTLRIVRGPLEESTVRPNEILVLEELPDEIPVVSGVISQPLQAPLGHLAILCGTRGTPNMALRQATQDPHLLALEGELVALTVGRQEYSLRAATQQEADAAWAVRRPQTILTPALNGRRRDLPNVCTARVSDASSLGAKAAQLGEACSIQVAGNPVRTPGGFVVPFRHYLNHLESVGLSRGIPQMLQDAAFQSDRGARSRALQDLRSGIERTSVDPGLLRRVRQKIQRFPGAPRVILRSSTNAEDLPGFTGAGLYESVVISGTADNTEIASALRRVWASVWRLGAYEEREWYRINHSQVAMGVIVQPFVDGAVANGVALTANPYFEGRPGFFVNAQALGGSVTGAQGDEIPEQYLIYTYAGFEAELVSRSSRNGGAPLFDEPKLRELHAVLQAIHDHFTPLWQRRAGLLTATGDTVQAQEGPAAAPSTDTDATGPTSTVAAEVEFLLAGEDRHVVVLQARPFTVRYSEQQR